MPEAPNSSRARRRRRQWGGEWVGDGEGYPLPSRLKGLGSVVSSPSGVRAEPRPKWNFVNIGMPKKPSGGTYFAEFSAIILRRLYREAVLVQARRFHCKKEIGQAVLTRAYHERDAEFLHTIITSVRGKRGDLQWDRRAAPRSTPGLRCCTWPSSWPAATSQPHLTSAYLLHELLIVYVDLYSAFYAKRLKCAQT